MRIIRARADDWVPNNPHIRVGSWIGAFVVVAVIYVAVAATMGELDDAHASLGTSMQRDIEAGVEPELDAIAGSVLRAAARHGIDCPTIRRLAERVAERAGAPAPLGAPR